MDVLPRPQFAYNSCEFLAVRRNFTRRSIAMMPFLRKLLGQNWLLLLSMLALAIFGVIAIYSATSSRADSYAADFWRKQANWVAVGVFAFILTSLVDYRWIRWGALPMYLAGIVFLVLTKFIGTKVYGARSWLHLGPINFQPAQLAVVAGIMVLALFLTQFRDIHPMLRLLLCGAIAAAPCLLILLQPDLGEVIIWIPVLLALLFVSGLPSRYLICIILIGLAFIPIAINFGLKPYQQQRITAFTHPDIDKQGSAWAINQSLIAIGSGGWSGKGFKAPNTQIELGFLPATAVHNDYIFSAIGEQWGFVGGAFLIGGFALLLITCLFVAFFAGDQLGMLLVIGITALVFTHIFQNMGMTIAMLPITGVPLPLISYSGSFVLMIMFGLGLVNSVWIHRHVPA
ncbi:MAG: rod shape-determining protein RodA [Verrucomicrobia bacterium]|nr:MAG: rod shape-determining protein RodA [Verrucomicrobiota bacterium]PYK34491.1 MAG: rod shape-determining protein RodA [Verrucomicrobiota bacterium]PYL81505.1 MAG: rod shape-determining protein RodA [Verrucomicrobiota bacterium]